MELGIYKYGQGYWVRVMTACLVGAITLATAGWLWGQGAIIADKLPRSSYLMAISIGQGEAKPDLALDLLGPSEGAASGPPVIGSATVRGYSAGDRVLKIDNVTMVPPHDPAETTSMASKDKAFGATVVARTFVAQALVEPFYIQGALAGLAILVGAVVAFWLAGMRADTVDFLIATDSEMKRVNWSTPREIRGQTYVVIGACFFLAGALFVFDLFFKTVFQLMGVLAK